MPSAEDPPTHPGGEPSARGGAARGLFHVIWRLITLTVDSCLKYRVTGLAAEAAFFAIVSVPPLIFGLSGAIGYVVEQVPDATVNNVRDALIEVTSKALTQDAVDSIITTTFDQVLEGGRADIISVGFLLALWSGSRALSVFVDTITIMYGLGEERGIIKTRALSFALYILALVCGAVSVPLVVAGPHLVRSLLPGRLEPVMALYWPVVILVCVCFLATLYHVSVPVRTKWTFNLPGATFTLVVWVVGSGLLRWALTATAADSTSVFGPLAAPIAVLVWLYLLSIAVLIGAALNAAFDTVFPQESTVRARRELVARLRARIGRREVEVPGFEDCAIEVGESAIGGPGERTPQSRTADRDPELPPTS